MNGGDGGAIMAAVQRLSVAVNDCLRRVFQAEQAAQKAMAQGWGQGGGGGGGSGFWAYLAPGQTVSAASGLTLGSGTVTLVTNAAGTLTALTDTVTVYNAGGAVAGGSVGYSIKIGIMDDGSFSLDVAPCAAAV
jgi:hypothetical protein